MNEPDPGAGRMAQWRDSMLSESSVRLLALARNYLGHVGPLGDKGKIVSGLSAMISRPEVQSAAMALMDRTDKLIVGVISAAGDMDKPALQKMLAGEISYHEMEYRLANLTERLILFRTREENFALNPLFDETARLGAARADILFGPVPARREGESVAPQADDSGARDLGRESPQPTVFSVQELGLIAYALLHEKGNLFLKSGELSARAKKRIATLLRGDVQGVGVVEALIHALYRAGLVREEDRGPLIDFRAFADFLAETGPNFPFAVCLAYVNGSRSNPYALLAEAFSPFFEREFSFSEAGLTRFIRLVLGDNPLAETFCGLPAALKDFGLLREENGLLLCSPERAASRWPTLSDDGYSAVSVEGTGTVRVLPSASLREVLALLDIGSLESASGAWSVSINRESSRRTFAAGWTAGDILRNIELMSGNPPPQTLRFDLERWEEEYDSIRLFRGYVLAVDGRTAKVIEGSGALSGFPHEKLAEGLYYFGNAQASAIEAALVDLGLPPPALRTTAKTGPGKIRRGAGKNDSGQRESRGRAGEPQVSDDAGAAPPEAAPLGTAAPPGTAVLPAAAPPAAAAKAREREEVAPRFDAGIFFAAKPEDKSLPGEEAAAGSLERGLLDEIAGLPLGERLRKQVEERVGRKLVYTLDQLHAMVKAGDAEAKAPGAAARLFDVGFVAGGLDFNGKIRIIQTALKAKFSRLDIRWAAEGEVKSALVRPVSLRKIERDYMLEGEDVAKGLPFSLRVGSMMQVGLQKGFLLGDE